MDPLMVAYFGLGFMAIVPIYFGSFGSLKKPESEEEEEQEFLSTEEAKMFPLYASASLFSLYLLFKYFDKNLINLLLMAYFVILGVFSLTQVLLSISRALSGNPLKGEFDLLFRHKKAPIIDVTFGYYHIFLLVVSAGIAGLYLLSKHWILSNIYGEVFSLTAIEFLKLDSFKTGMLLLSGLFFYDVFWVFGTDVMVTVAKSFDAPIKVIWPKDIFALISQGLLKVPEGTQFSLLGLGDIVLPGIYVALCLRFDQHRYLATPEGKKNPSNRSFAKPYFYAGFIAYIIGLATTMFVMHTFKAAQPALLYLSPACILSTLFTSVVLGEWEKVMSFKDEDDSSSSEKKKSSKKSRGAKKTE